MTLPIAERILLFAVLMLMSRPGFAAGPAAGVPPEQQCLGQLIEGSGPEIECLHVAWFTPGEQADIKKLTRGYLENAVCRVTVKIARKEIDAALDAAEYVFQSPPQPVTCDLTTSRGPFSITATFAPRVVFKGGVAVEGSPGLADVKGVNSYLAWPVVHYVNYAQRISGPMLLIINAYKTHRLAGAKK